MEGGVDGGKRFAGKEIEQVVALFNLEEWLPRAAGSRGVAEDTSGYVWREEGGRYHERQETLKTVKLESLMVMCNAGVTVYTTLDSPPPLHHPRTEEGIY